MLASAPLIDRLPRTPTPRGRSRVVPAPTDRGRQAPRLTRRQLTGAHEERFRLIRLALIQVHPPEPDQCRDVVGRDLEHTPERGDRPGDVPLAPVQVREEVGHRGSRGMSLCAFR